jgi:hypothetical protein
MLGFDADRCRLVSQPETKWECPLLVLHLVDWKLGFGNVAWFFYCWWWALPKADQIETGLEHEPFTVYGVCHKAPATVRGRCGWWLAMSLSVSYPCILLHVCVSDTSMNAARKVEASLALLSSTQLAWALISHRSTCYLALNWRDSPICILYWFSEFSTLNWRDSPICILYWFSEFSTLNWRDSLIRILYWFSEFSTLNWRQPRIAIWHSTSAGLH